MIISINKGNLFHLVLIIAIILLIYSFILVPSEFYQSIRGKASDFLYSVQHFVFSPPKEIDQFAVVAIDDKTIELSKMRWPWERRIFAEILRKINSFEPEIIYLNFTLAGESRNVEDDMLLSTAINEAGNVVLPSYYDLNMELVSPLEAFTMAAKKMGFINKVSDEDGIVRRFHPFIKTEDGSIEDYAVELCILGSLYNINEEEISNKIPLKEDDSTYINYLALPKDVKTYSLVDILTNKIDLGLLKNKVILLGGTTEIIHDIYKTPLGNMSGVYILANTSATIMSKRFLVEMNYFLMLCLIIFTSLLIGFLTFKHGIMKGISIVLLTSIFTFIISAVMFRQGVILDWFSPVIIMLVTSVSIAFVRYVAILKIHVNELQMANIEIRNAQREIVRREQLSTIGKLTSIIIHEMNNPLANIKNIAERLTEKIQGTEAVQKMLFLLQQEILRAKKIGEDLKFSYTPHAEEKILIDINKIIKDILETIDKSKGIKLELSLALELPLIPVSIDKIKQVFLNIVLNAIDATESGKHIYITTRTSENKWVEVIFKDEGCGIPKEELDRIFNAFHTTKKHRKGSGLGLFISYEIIKAHNGNILVDSEVGKGTTFTIRLPVK